jgi:hypothetical protein
MLEFYIERNELAIEYCGNHLQRHGNRTTKQQPDCLDGHCPNLLQQPHAGVHCPCAHPAYQD